MNNEQWTWYERAQAHNTYIIVRTATTTTFTIIIIMSGCWTLAEKELRWKIDFQWTRGFAVLIETTNVLHILAEIVFRWLRAQVNLLPALMRKRDFHFRHWIFHHRIFFFLSLIVQRKISTYLDDNVNACALCNGKYVIRIDNNYLPLMTCNTIVTFGLFDG